MTQPQLAGPLGSGEPPQQQTGAPSTALGSLQMAPVAPTIQKPSPTPTTCPPDGPPMTNAAILKGIAASALGQPSDSSDTTSSTMEHIPKPSLQPPPNLRVSTNLSNSASAGRASAAPSSARNETVFRNLQANMATQSPNNVDEAGPARASQLLRPNPGPSGKRPSMRHITTAEPEMTQTEKDNRTQKIRDIINEQFSLEILLKHRELQDIEAELGKAEACLEQIRRCSIEEAMERDGHFDDPSGEVLVYAPSRHVLEGTYSRDYSDWLAEERVPTNRARYHDVLAANQSQNFVLQQRGRQDRQDPQGSKRPRREAAMPSEKRPTICLHRQPDGSVVKLACPDCQRDTFGSMQGFINHCRLAHQRDFQTHDHAAAACGTPFDTTKYDGPLPPPRSNKASKYASLSAQPAAPKPSRATVNAKAAPKANKKKNGGTPQVSEPTNIVQAGPLTPPPQADDVTLQKTIQTSHLKQYLWKKQMEVENLDAMVEEAVNRVGMVDEESEDEEEDSEDTNDVAKRTQKQTKSSHQPVTSAPILVQGPESHVPKPRNAPSQPIDVDMVDAPVETTLQTNTVDPPTSDVPTTETVAAETNYESIQAATGAGEVSMPVQATTPVNKTHDEEEEQPRPTSRRSNQSSRQSPRTPIAPAPVRMGTRAHPSPDADQHNTRHSARLADAGKPNPSKRA
ncbi:hypothetical protein AA313_de0203029 [Arthrobotrys entomopaga]|nr:hypothetical protein AA313_de0203029 [Arthrobotrys entomopaga]